MTALDDTSPVQRDSRLAIRYALAIADQYGSDAALSWLSDYDAGIGGLSATAPDVPEVA